MRNVGVWGLIAVLCVCANTYGTVAELTNPPTWRTAPLGTPPTTFQAWSFSESNNPAIADIVENDFGDPTLDITINSATGMHLTSYNGRSGVWKLTALDLIDVNIPNTGINTPGTWKEIWMQIIYSDPAGSGDAVPIATDPDYTSLVRESSQSLANDYLLDTYKIIIEPNPPSQELLTMAIQCNIYVSAIGIDTICIPEPATIGMLGLGGLLLRRKRRA